MVSICRCRVIIAVLILLSPWGLSAEGQLREYLEARWDPIHFQPAINTATNEQCLECHTEILENKPLSRSPAGVEASNSRAWYQTHPDYTGEQDTFHRRHLVSETAKQLMNFKCNTCHQGNNPSTEVSSTPAQPHADPVIRKKVDNDICLMCHGKFDYKVMSGLAGDWPEVREQFKNDCVTCHLEFRTVRHRLNFLKADAIEKAGKESSDSCYGCHGGRSWYAVAYPYVRTPWLARMPAVAPAWAQGRRSEYPDRFLRNARPITPLKREASKPEKDDDDKATTAADEDKDKDGSGEKTDADKANEETQ